jgi:hypothetical protein
MNKICASVALIAIAVVPLPIFAQGTITAGPALVMLKGNVGESTTQTLTVSNGGDRPMSFEMVAKDIVIRDGKRVFVDAGEVPGSIAATAVFSQKVVTVPPGQSARVDMHLTIPPRATPRAVVALFRGTTKVPSGPMNMTASLGLVFMFTLSDNVSMSTSPLVVQPPTTSRNLTAAQKCTNVGTEPFNAKAVLAILNASGRLVGKGPVPDRRLLPGERAEVRAEYAGDLPPGNYRALMTYDLGGKTVTSTAEFRVR